VQLCGHFHKGQQLLEQCTATTVTVPGLGPAW
jgi:hypothetical protein